jgi:hypothetical protein
MRRSTDLQAIAAVKVSFPIRQIHTADPQRPDDIFMGNGGLLILNLPPIRTSLPTAVRP